jgi:hypothetical protein
MATTNLDPHECIAVQRRIGEIEAELKALEDCGQPRAVVAKQWDRLLAELADLQDKIK